MSGVMSIYNMHALCSAKNADSYISCKRGCFFCGLIRIYNDSGMVATVSLYARNDAQQNICQSVIIIIKIPSRYLSVTV